MKRALKKFGWALLGLFILFRFIFQSEYTGWYLVRFRLIQCLPPWLVEITYLFLCKFPDVEYTRKILYGRNIILFIEGKEHMA